MIRKSVPMPMITVELALHRKFSPMFNPHVHQLHPKFLVPILASTVMVNLMNNMRNKFIKKHFRDFQQRKHVVQNYNEMLTVLMSLHALFGIAHRMRMSKIRARMINQRILLLLLSSNHEIVFKSPLQAFYRNFIIVNRCKHSNNHRWMRQHSKPIKVLHHGQRLRWNKHKRRVCNVSCRSTCKNNSFLFLNMKNPKKFPNK